MRDHGTRACYVFGPEKGQGKGCRCEPCRQANRDYARLRERRRANPDIWGKPTDLVPGIEAAIAIEELRDLGLGLRTIERAAGVNRNNLVRITLGGNARVKASTLARLQRLSTRDIPKGGYLSAAPTWKLLEVLLAAGYSKVRLARLLGNDRALQISRRRVRVFTARKVEDLYARLWQADPRVQLVPGAVPPVQRAA